jgi:membrane fusion protein
VISSSTAMVSLMWVMSTLILGLLVVLFNIRYKETVPSRGVLESFSPALEVVSPVVALVSKVYVAEGQSVAAGDVLVLLTTEVRNGAGHRPEDISIAQLKMKISLLEKERILSREMYSTKVEQASSNISLVESKLKSLNQSVLLSKERLSVNDANLKSFTKLLETSSVSKLQHTQQKLIFLEAAQYTNNIEFERLESESKLSDLYLEVKALEIQYLTTKSDYDQQIELLHHEIEGLENSHLITIVSSNDGVVTGMAIKQGMVVKPQQHLMQVSNPDNVLIATLFVSSRIIGMLHTEQLLRLSFDTFPVNEYGYYDATIVQIGGTPLDPRATPLPVQSSNQPVFRVVARLEQNFVEGPDTHPLKSGYEFTAHVVTENLSLLEFVFKPLISLRQKNV